MSTWNSSDKSANITLSGGNLVATWNASAGGLRSTTSKTSGKLYFEVQFTTIKESTGAGLANATLATTALSSLNTNVIYARLDASSIQGNSTTLGSSNGALTAGQWGSFAVDITNQLFWYRANGGNWNANVTNNPATGVGGISFSYLTGPFFVYAGTTAGTTGNVVTANFGGSAFAFTVPTGFSAWDLTAGIGTSDGVAAVSGVGASTATSVGSSTGTSAVAGVSQAIANAIGTAAGVAAISGLAPTYTTSVGTSTGTSSVSGVGAAVFKAIGTAAGQAAVSGTGDLPGIGVATGQANALGISSTVILSVGTSDGQASMSGWECLPDIDQPLSAVGQADGVSSVIGIAFGTASAVGTANGIANVNGISSSTIVLKHTGTSDGVAFVQGISTQPAIVFDGAILLAGL